MKKIILSTLLVSTIALVGIQSASAATVKEAETPVGIEFEEETDVVPGPYKGVLTMVYKPSAINFGKVKATGGSMTVPATNLSDPANKQWLVVNDDRDYATKPENSQDENNKKGGKWKLTAKMDEMAVGTGASKKVFAGTKLNLNFEDPQGYVIGDNEITLPNGVKDLDPKHPNTDASAIIALPATEKIDLKKSLSLDAGGTVMDVMSKTEETTEKSGVAANLSSANLTIQSDKAISGQANSKITWTLGTGL